MTRRLINDKRRLDSDNIDAAAHPRSPQAFWGIVPTVPSSSAGHRQDRWPAGPPAATFVTPTRQAVPVDPIRARRWPVRCAPKPQSQRPSSADQPRVHAPSLLRLQFVNRQNLSAESVVLASVLGPLRPHATDSRRPDRGPSPISRPTLPSMLLSDAPRSGTRPPEPREGKRRLLWAPTQFHRCREEETLPGVTTLAKHLLQPGGFGYHATIAKMAANASTKTKAHITATQTSALRHFASPFAGSFSNSASR